MRRAGLFDGSGFWGLCHAWTKLFTHAFRAAVLLLAGGGLASQAIANDTTAVMVTGGLVFKQTDSIRMVSEVLKISIRRIEVDDVFRNVYSFESQTLP
jgi:hypothetical protein